MFKETLSENKSIVKANGTTLLSTTKTMLI